MHQLNNKQVVLIKFSSIRNKKHQKPGDASIVFIGFPVSISQIFIIASSELEAKTDPVLFMSTDTTPN